MNKKTVTVKVYDSDSWKGKRLPSMFIDLQQWVYEVGQKIPPEFRDTASVCFNAEDGYEGEHFIDCCISYCRPETDEEYAARVESDKVRKQQEEEADWVHFLKLKQKFESK